MFVVRGGKYLRWFTLQKNRGVGPLAINEATNDNHAASKRIRAQLASEARRILLTETKSREDNQVRTAAECDDRREPSTGSPEPHGSGSGTRRRFRVGHGANGDRFFLHFASGPKRDGDRDVFAARA